MGAVSKKNISDRLIDDSDVIFEVPKCPKILICRGSAPDPTAVKLSQSVRGLHCSPDLLAGGKGTRCPISNNPTPVLGLSIRPRFYGSQLGLTHYRVV